MAVAGEYYYAQLNKDEQQVYHAMKKGLMALEPSFTVPLLSAGKLADIYFLLRMDHPEIFYTVNFSWRSYKGADSAELIPEYLFSKKQILEHRKAMEARIQRICRQCREACTVPDTSGKNYRDGRDKGHKIRQNTAEESEWKTEQFIHDFLCENITYDKLKKPYSHEIIGALGNGVAVCEGIAKAVKILCDQLGIWCIVALSEANPQKGIRYRHAWNVIKTGKNYYHLDVTFDNTLSRGKATASPFLRYDYFNLSDRQIFRDHEPSIYRLPACLQEENSWYRLKKLSFTKQEEVAKRAVQAARRHKPFLFQWRGGYLTKEVLEELLQILESAAAVKDRSLQVSLNWPQAVILASYEEKEIPEEDDSTSDMEGKAGDDHRMTEERDGTDSLSVIYEKANEGELYEGQAE